MFLVVAERLPGSFLERTLHQQYECFGRERVIFLGTVHVVATVHTLTLSLYLISIASEETRSHVTTPRYRFIMSSTY